MEGQRPDFKTHKKSNFKCRFRASHLLLDLNTKIDTGSKNPECSAEERTFCRRLKFQIMRN